jgi:uncharacterized protein YndB with AHSA1/START domain
MTATLAYSLERVVVIRAARDTVFRFFTDSQRWAAWWGAGSTIDAKPGGVVRIRYPDGTEASGEVVELAAPERIVFTYGYTSGKPIPAGSSRVTIHLDPHADGTRLRLTHDFADAAVRDDHVQGWRYQLSLFGNVVANEAYAGAADAVDNWFTAWAIVDERERRTLLERIATSSIQFRDRFSVIDGMSELVPHIGAALRFMPGIRPQRKGHVRHCQGTVLADWTAVTADGSERGSGTNVFHFGPDGRFDAVTGFWN